jgi:Tol biopolymer transport system component
MKIAFQSDRDGNDEIYVMSADGSNQTRLTNNPASDTSPTWSPDGTRIAFVSNRDGDPNIYVMNADGTGVTKLTSDPGVDENPTFSPDGSKIAFDSDRTGQPQIFVMNTNGTSQTNISNNGSSEIDPSFAPSGSAIAFISGETGFAEVWTMAPDGSGRTHIDAGLGTLSGPSFAPDGSQIAVSADAVGNTILVLNLDGTHTALTDDFDNVSPDWQPTTSALSIKTSAKSPVGNDLTISGRLQLFQASSNDQTVSLWATAPGGAPAHLTDTVTAADGSYSFTTAPDVTGAWAFEVRFGGDATHDPASRVTTVAVDVRATKLTIGISKHPVTYGRSVLVTAHLAAHHTNSLVTIYRKPYGRAATVLKSGAVSANGDLSVRYKPARNTQLWATWAGDAWYKPASSTTKTLKVRVVVTAAMVGGYASSRSYRLYHYTSACPSRHTGCPAVSVKVRPNHAGKRVYVQLFARVSGQWRHVTDVTVKLNAKSSRTLTIIYRNRTIIGHRFRIHVGFLGDADHLGNTAANRYFEVTS